MWSITYPQHILHGEVITHHCWCQASGNGKLVLPHPRTLTDPSPKKNLRVLTCTTASNVASTAYTTKINCYEFSPSHSAERNGCTREPLDRLWLLLNFILIHQMHRHCCLLYVGGSPHLSLNDEYEEESTRMEEENKRRYRGVCIS